jgi:stage II sporulation protein M
VSSDETTGLASAEPLGQPGSDDSLPPGNSERLRLRAILADARPALWFAVVAFAVSVAVGFVVSDRMSHWVHRILAGMRTPEEPFWAEFIKMLWHNALLDYLAIALGYATFGLVPGVFLLVNGVLLGLVIGQIVPADRLATVGLLLPHGVFEIPASILASGMGLWIGFCGRALGVKSGLARGHRVFLRIILPLLILAAGIESWKSTTWRPRFKTALPSTTVNLSRDTGL